MISVQSIDTRNIVALIAVIERMKTTPSPAKKAGRINGNITRRNVVASPAPRLAEASSMLLSICAAAQSWCGCRSGCSGTRNRR